MDMYQLSTATSSNATKPGDRPSSEEEEDGQLLGLVNINDQAWGIACLLLLALWLFALMANVLVMLVIQRSRRVQSTTNFFVTSLAAGDVALLLLPAPLVAARILSPEGHWHAGDPLCRLARFAQFVCMASTNFVLVVVCVDRFYTILYPLSFKVTRGTAKRLILCTWAISAFISVPALYFFQLEELQVFVQDEMTAHPVSVCPTFIPATHVAGLVYAVICLLSHYVCPIVLLAIGYSRIFYHIRTVHRHARRCGGWAGDGCGAASKGNRYRATVSSPETNDQQTNHSNACGSRNINGNQDRNQNSCLIHQRTTTPPHTLSTCSLHRQHNPVPRAKVKMVRMLAYLTACTLLMQLPYYVSHSAYSLHRQRYFTADAFLVSFWLLCASAALKPIIYACSNSNFWRGCKEMLCMSAMRCYRLNNYTVTHASAMSRRNYVGVMDVSKEQDIDVTVVAPGLAFNRTKVMDKTAWPIGGSALPSSWL